MAEDLSLGATFVVGLLLASNAIWVAVGEKRGGAAIAKVRRERDETRREIVRLDQEIASLRESEASVRGLIGRGSRQGDGHGVLFDAAVFEADVAGEK